MTRSPLAVVIEPRADLAQTVAEVLRARGFEAIAASTHAGAAAAVAAMAKVDFLAAAVPAPGESHAGAYLEEARGKNPGLAVVIMLSDPNESVDDAPANAARVVKPFSLEELRAAIEQAMSKVQQRS
jgi:DNA-binding response OmpR family regulator